DVFVLGEAAGEPYDFDERKWPITPRVIPTGVGTLADFAGLPWADRLIEGQAEFAAIVTASDRESLRHAFLMAFTLGVKAAAHLMIEPIDAGLPADSTLLTLDFRILLAPRAAHGAVVFRRSKFKRIGPLRPIAEPVWDWVIRAATDGEKID